MIFLDTSAIYAWADAADPNHPIAVRRLRLILEAGEGLLTHNYVLVESMALLQARLGLAADIKLAKDATTFVIEWVDEDLHGFRYPPMERVEKAPRQSSGSHQLSCNETAPSGDRVRLRPRFHRCRVPAVRGIAGRSPLQEFTTATRA
jgi:predicted nucleic acid-binding protein